MGSDAFCLIFESVDELLGYEKSGQPDWFQESADELRPQLQRRNNAYDRWLASGKEERWLPSGKEERWLASGKEERWLASGKQERWLASGKEEDLTRFKVARNEARKSIREEQRIVGSEPRQRRQKESVFGGRRCGSP